MEEQFLSNSGPLSLTPELAQLTPPMHLLNWSLSVNQNGFVILCTKVSWLHWIYSDVPHLWVAFMNKNISQMKKSK